MSINFTIPHNAKLLTPKVVFEAVFNAITPGVYDFGSAINIDRRLLSINTDTVYFIDRLSIGGNIDESKFSNAIEMDLTANITPQMILRRKILKEPIFTDPYGIIGYDDDREFTAFFSSEKKNDELLIDMTGVLNQTAELVGVQSIRLTIEFSIYEVRNVDYYTSFKSALSDNIGESLRGIR